MRILLNRYPVTEKESIDLKNNVFPVFMRLPGLLVSQEVSVYSSQKMTFLDGCTQFCTQVAENWKMVVFGQKIRKVRSFSTQKMLRLLTF